MAQDDDSLVELGHISGAHGVKGWVKVHSHSRPQENILGYSPWRLKTANGWQSCTVIGGRRQGKGIVAQLEGIDDRDAAAALRGAGIAVSATQLPALEEDEYYWRDLIGLEVINLEEVVLGTVDHLVETSNNDVLVLRGDRERLIPYLPERVVLDIDLAAGRMQVDWDADF